MPTVLDRRLRSPPVDVAAGDREQAEAERDQDLLDQRPELCLAFVTSEEAAPPLMHRAAQAGIPLRVIVSLA